MKSPDEINKGLDFCSRTTCGEKGVKCPYECGKSICITHLTVDALALIQQLEAQVPRWISVEERLPETCRESRSFYHSVSVLAFEKGRIMLGYFDTCKDDGAWCFVGTDTEEYYDDCAKPTHWMPLPKPPKD